MRAALAVGASAVALFAAVRVAAVAGDPVNWGEDAHQVRAARSALEQAPCDPARVQALAELLLSPRDYYGAAKVLDQATDSCDLPPNVHALALQIHQQVRDRRRAIVDATRLIEKMPDDPRFLVARGALHDADGEPFKAASDYEEALVRSPSDVEAYRRLFDVAKRMGRRDFVSALLKWHFDVLADASAAAVPRLVEQAPVASYKAR